VVVGAEAAGVEAAEAEGLLEGVREETEEGDSDYRVSIEEDKI